MKKKLTLLFSVSLASLVSQANSDHSLVEIRDADFTVGKVVNNSPPETMDVSADSINLDEVVVTGQGNAIQRRRLSTNITKLSAAELQKHPNYRIDQMLQGALPNVQISMTGGQPGSTSLIKARGLSSAFSNSTPIIYVDGIRVDNLNTGSALVFSKSGYGTDPYTSNDMPMGEMAASSALSDIPLENIDHIEYVTGGAATTLYGSDASNGVIQIFTKKGGAGRFRAIFGIQMGLADATSQYYHFKRTKDLLNQTGMQQTYRLHFDGGNEKYGYSFGASMSEQTGIVVQNANKNRKYDLSFGSHLQITPKLEYQNSFGLIFQDYKRSRNGNQGFYTGLWFAEGSASTNFTYTAADGQVQNYPANIDAADPETYALMKAFVNKAEALQNNREDVKRFQTSQSLIYTPFKNFTLKGIFGLDYRNVHNKEIVTNEYLIHTQVKPEGTSDAGRINNFNREYTSITADVNAQYKFYHQETFSNIATVGFQYFNTHDQQAIYNGRDVRDGALIISGAGKLQADEWLSYLHSYGFYVQDNIGFYNRYYFDLGMRVDYNTAFGDNVHWQFYPKVGFSYMLTEEPFMKRWTGWNEYVDWIRIMANYGVAGSYPPAFEYQKTIALSSFQNKQTATFGQYGNPDLGPEKKHSYEAGFQASLLHQRLMLGMTYYYTLTKGALFRIPTLPSSGQTSTYLANIGKIENKGIEIVVGGTPVKTKDWSVNLKATLNTNHNLVLSTGGQQPFGIGGFGPSTIQNVIQEGKPVGFLRGNKAVLNEDGTLKEVLTLQDLGNTIPTLYGNLSADVTYKSWQLYVNGDYQAGAYVHSFDRQFRFQKGLQDVAIPTAALGGKDQKSQWLNFTNFFVEKSDFLKIRNIGLSYSHHLNSKKLPIHQIMLGFNVYNPFAWTAASVDPEAVLSGAQSQGAVAVGGLNYSTYSSPRQYVFSVQLEL